MMVPVCVSCATQMRCAKNGYVVEFEGSEQQHSGDMYYCPDCGLKVVVDFGREPLVEGWDDRGSADLVVSQ